MKDVALLVLAWVPRPIADPLPWSARVLHCRRVGGALCGRGSVPPAPVVSDAVRRTLLCCARCGRHAESVCLTYLRLRPTRLTCLFNEGGEVMKPRNII